MKRTYKPLLLALSGLALLILGIVLIRAISQPEGMLRSLPYLCVGIGCGLLGHGAGDLLVRRADRADPEGAAQRAIAQNDERNRMIAQCAKAKAYDAMLPVFGALMLAFALMGVDMLAVLLLATAYLLVCGYSIYCRIKLDKTM